METPFKQLTMQSENRIISGTVKPHAVRTTLAPGQKKKRVASVLFVSERNLVNDAGSSPPALLWAMRALDHKSRSLQTSKVLRTHFTHK
jgi:hypothetical protein